MSAVPWLLGRASERFRVIKKSAFCNCTGAIGCADPDASTNNVQSLRVIYEDASEAGTSTFIV